MNHKIALSALCLLPLVSYTATADGALIVDGICIYEMQAFTLEFGKLDATTTAIDSKKIPEQKM